MLNNDQQKLGLGFIAGIIFAIYIGATTFKYLPSPTELFGEVGSECYKVAQNSDNKKLDGKALSDCLTLSYSKSLSDFTKWLVFVTISVAVVGFAQFELARRTARRQLRAYISLDGGSIRTVSGPDNTLFIEGFVSLKNFGRTAAHNHRSWVKIDVCDADKSPFDDVSEGLGRVIMGPGTEANLPVHWGPITNADLQAVRNGTKHIFVWGGSEYVDVFGKERFFKFYEWNANEIPGKGWPLAPSDKPQEAN
jgi:hypothetical protein